MSAALLLAIHSRRAGHASWVSSISKVTNPLAPTMTPMTASSPRISGVDEMEMRWMICILVLLQTKSLQEFGVLRIDLPRGIKHLLPRGASRALAVGNDLSPCVGERLMFSEGHRDREHLSRIFPASFPHLAPSSPRTFAQSNDGREDLFPGGDFVAAHTA